MIEGVYFRVVNCSVLVTYVYLAFVDDEAVGMCPKLSVCKYESVSGFLTPHSLHGICLLTLIRVAKYVLVVLGIINSGLIGLRGYKIIMAVMSSSFTLGCGKWVLKDCN